MMLIFNGMGYQGRVPALGCPGMGIKMAPRGHKMLILMLLRGVKGQTAVGNGGVAPAYVLAPLRGTSPIFARRREGGPPGEGSEGVAVAEAELSD